MAAWFHSYAEHFGLHERIRFGSRVTRAEPRDGGSWVISRETYPVLGVPFGNCQFHTHDLQRDLARGRRKASR